MFCTPQESNSDLRGWTLPCQPLGHRYVVKLAISQESIPNNKFLERHPTDISLQHSFYT